MFFQLTRIRSAHLRF